ncbi:MAG TPA: YbhB/YbcL family Raf kinase inhibitor-like protein [Kofleriaceae bacterium]|nr:YbhB/YbcL family Raf kinase inhibitor-like protein [Kofleriaceae bacterium]
MSRLCLATACALALAGCGNDGGGTVTDAAVDAPTDAAIDAAIDAPTGPLTLTSSVLAEGAAFPVDYTCNGANESPPMTFTNAPVGTLSFAVTLTDVTNGLVHWAIYDIPALHPSLPEDVDKTYEPTDVPGAHQTKSFNAQVTGYQGPCPPAMHMYTLTLYALDVATLPGTDVTTTRAQVQALAAMHQVGMATLDGTYTPPAMARGPGGPRPEAGAIEP